MAETFCSIQGESTYAGLVCYFIRLAGCNLNCRYCDTQYARKAETGQEISIQSLVEKVDKAEVPLVEITGGEPLVQQNVVELCRKLLDKSFTVLVETNGSLPITVLPVGVIRIMDCKTPSSGCEGKMDYTNFFSLKENDEVKFTIADRDDYRYALEIIDKYSLYEKTEKILFSPVWGKIKLSELAEWMIRDKVYIRLQLQMHKYIWEPDRRCV